MTAANSAGSVKNDIIQTNREWATPADSPLSPLSAARRIVADWMAGIGFLRFHAAAFAVAGAALLLIDLILNPSDPWAVDLLRVWLILLGSHAVGLVTGWVTWRAIRPYRLTELRRVLSDADEEDAPPSNITAIPTGPLPATGRFTPERRALSTEDEEDQREPSGVLAAIGDAVADIGDLTLAGGAALRRGMGRLLDWIRGDEGVDDEDAVAETESQRHRPDPIPAPARWVVPPGTSPNEVAPAAHQGPGPAPGYRPPTPIVPVPRPSQIASPPANGQRPNAEPTPLSPRPAKRREVSG